MEIWFWASVAGATLAGISNFFFKIAASRGYNAEIFTLYGALFSTILMGLGAFFFEYNIYHLDIFVIAMFVSGVIASAGGIMKVYALRHIDSTIFFPLFKLLSPSLAIVLGIVFFAESFTGLEWTGMLIGLTVPLLLITKTENSRQNNLKAGLILIVLTAISSAAATALGKFSADAGINVVVGVFYSSVGIIIGTVLTILYKQGFRSFVKHIQTDSNMKMFLYGSSRSVVICLSMGLVLYSYSQGGTLGIVQTIHSMYILIPIVLSIIFYNEHWNTQKAVAIILSLASLALLG